MLAGSLITLTVWGLSKNERVRMMVEDAISNMKRNGMDELEDMM